MRRSAEALYAAAPALAQQESAATGRPLVATILDAQECARAFAAAAAVADALRRTRVDREGGRVEERAARPGRAVDLGAHWSRPLLDLGRAAFSLAQGDAVRLVADPHAAAPLAQAHAALLLAGLPEAALSCETRPFAPDPDARFGRAGPKSALIVLSGADMRQAAHAALRGGRAWSGSSFASQSLVYVQETALAPFLEACAAVEPPLWRPLRPAHAAWIAELTATARRDGGPSQVYLTRGPDSPLARAHLFAALVAVVAFASDDELVVALGARNLALGLFGGDFSRARGLLDALDPPLAYVNDDGLGPLLWPPPDMQTTPQRCIIWGGPQP